MAFKVTKKMEKEHKKMLEKNVELAKTKWKTFVDDMANIGYVVDPKMEATAMPGLYAAVTSIRSMSPEEYDRHKNPDKWASIDEKRKEDAKKLSTDKRGR